MEVTGLYNKGVKDNPGDEYTNEVQIPCAMANTCCLAINANTPGDYKSENEGYQGGKEYTATHNYPWIVI